MTLERFLKTPRKLSEIVELLGVSKTTALKRLQEIGATRVGTGPKALWTLTT